MRTLPKIWQQRISKYWDKTMPTDYPNSSSEFSFKFDTDEDKEAVATFEEELESGEQSVVNEVIGENSFVNNYFGTYNVTGEAGELTLLSPERIDTDDNIAAFHLSGETWEQIEDAQLINGYAWGTLESFSPIAIVSYKKDIEAVGTPDFAANGKWIVANGNPVRVFTDAETGKIKVQNNASGKIIDLDDNNVICGGSIDGTYVPTASISVVGVENTSLGLYAGSYCWDNEDETITNTMDSATVNVIDSKIRATTGAGGRVRLNNLVINYKNSSAASHIASGETWNTKAKKDANGTGKNLGFGSVGWCKNTTINLEDSYVELLYSGGNTGYTYTDNATMNLKNSKIDWLVCGGSNGRSRNVVANIDGVTSKIFQTNNRGTVDTVVAKFNDSSVENLFVFGDATDKTVTGVTTTEVAIDIEKGTYNIALGTQGGEPATANDISKVRYVKYSRSANVTIDDKDKVLLGSKLVVK